MMATGSLGSLAGAWASGVATLAAVIAAIGPLLRRVELGLLFGSLTSALVMVVCLCLFLRSGPNEQVRNEALPIPEL
jgi:hypothetical protein